MINKLEGWQTFFWLDLGFNVKENASFTFAYLEEMK